MNYKFNIYNTTSQSLHDKLHCNSEALVIAINHILIHHESNECCHLSVSCATYN